MEVRIRILQRTHPSHTPGAHVGSPAALISGTAVPALRPDVNTAELFSGDTVTIGRIFAQAEKPVRLRAAKAKKRSSKRVQKTTQAQVDFGMIPAFVQAKAPGKPESQSLEMRPVHTPLKVKAQEELSDFEREYPW